LVFLFVIDGHIILLPQGAEVCGKFFKEKPHRRERRKERRQVRK
jgi:hypothetical protein